MNTTDNVKRFYYVSPEVEVLYCGADAPLLDSPGGGFSGDEGGLEIDDLD